jgi:hypothetical protein
LEDFGGAYAICFKYPTRTYNPLTKQLGGKWDCARMGFWAKDITEVRSGDIFELTQGKLPHVLSRNQTTFDALLKK